MIPDLPAADTFRSSLKRSRYDYDTRVLVDEQLQLMKRHLVEARRWQETVALGKRLKSILLNPALDRGMSRR